MPRTSDFIAAATAQLEVTLYPMRVIDAPTGFTEMGRARAEAFLTQFSEQEFNAGFDAAMHKILGVDAALEAAGVPKNAVSPIEHHPDYVRDRAAAYRKARE